MEDDDMHICLVCQTTIHGLLNYVNHKKNECTGRKDSKSQSKQQSSFPTGGVVIDIRNHAEGANRSANVSSSYIGHQRQFTLAGTSIENMPSLSTAATINSINSALDLLDQSQFPVVSTESVEHISDLGSLDVKVSPVSCQTLYDQQSTAITSQARLDISSTLSTLPLSSIFTPSSQNGEAGDSKVLEQEYNGSEDHGILNTCLKSRYAENDIENKRASEKVDDFFLSLELMSKNDPRVEKGATGFSQPLLPITNILNNLNFSSDEDDLGFDFTEDVSFDSLTEDSDTESAPQATQKLRTSETSQPGERSATVQRNRPVFRGKWPPGEAPVQTAHKYYGGRSGAGKQIKLPPLPSEQKRRGRGRPPKLAKSYRCNICDVEFSSQPMYANHCSGPSHKEKVFGRQEVPQYKKGKGKSFKYMSEGAKEKVGKTHSDDVEEFDLAAQESYVEEDLIENQNVSGTHQKVKEEISEEIDVARQASTEYSNKVNAADSNSETVNDVGKGASDSSDLSGVTLKQEDKKDGVVETAEDYMSATPLEMFRCTICCKQYTSRYKIARHLLTKGHKAQAAMQPEDSFALLTTYHKHLVRLSPFQCEICRYYFIDNKAFEDHLKCEDHVENCSDLIGQMMCSMCKFRSHSHTSIIEHLESKEHVANIAKRSKVCVFKESHVKCQCKYCGLEMVSFTRLKRHVQFRHVDKEIVMDVIKKKHGVRNVPYCILCQRQFQSSSAFFLHYRRIHSTDKPFKCDYCNVGFAGKHALFAHYKTRKHLENMSHDGIDKANDKVDIRKRRVTKRRKVAPLRRKIIEDQGVESTEERYIVNNKIVDTLEIEHIELDNVKDNANVEAENGSIATATDAQRNGNEADHPEKQVIISEEAVGDFDQTSNASEEEFIDDENDVEWVPAASVKKESTDRKNQQHKIADEKDKRKEQKKEERKGGSGKRRVTDQWKKRYNQKVRQAPLKCDHCDYTVTCYNDLRPHYLKEHSAQIQLCEVCDQIFLSLKALRIHELSKEHQDNIGKTEATADAKYYQCYICKKKFTDEKYCKFHTAYQHFHCTTEDAVLKEMNGKDITREKYKDFLAEVDKLGVHEHMKCLECPSLLKKRCFLEHLRIHTGDRPFKCRICPKGFTSYISLRRHLIGHFGCLERTCEECGKFYKKASSYEEHMKIHALEKSNSGKKHTCETCGLSFFFESQLLKHVVRHRKKEFACEFPGCHWKFVFRTELKHHMSSHSNLRPYLCDICGYGAATKCRLKRHRRTHAGERKYHCEYCTYKAGNSTHLRRHMRIHIGSKPYKCPYCDYACNTHENVRKHIVQTQKHKGLMIYPCKFCKYATNSCNEFRAHLNKEHEDEIGPNFQSYNVSSFSGLYNKTEDLRKPLEGTKIIPLKERLPRSEPNPDRVEKKRKKKKKKEIPNKTADNDEDMGSRQQRDGKYVTDERKVRLGQSDLLNLQYDQKDITRLHGSVSSTTAPSNTENGFSGNSVADPKHDELYKHLTCTTSIKVSPSNRNIHMKSWHIDETTASQSVLGRFSGSKSSEENPSAKRLYFQDVISLNIPSQSRDSVQELQRAPVPRKLVPNNHLSDLQPVYAHSLLDSDTMQKCSSNVSSHGMNFQSNISVGRSASGGIVPVASFSQGQGQDPSNSGFIEQGLTQSAREMAFPYHDYSMSSHRNGQEDAAKHNALVIDMEYTTKQF